jgi:hypothetical protein
VCVRVSMCVGGEGILVSKVRCAVDNTEMEQKVLQNCTESIVFIAGTIASIQVTYFWGSRADCSSNH